MDGCSRPATYFLLPLGYYCSYCRGFYLTYDMIFKAHLHTHDLLEPNLCIPLDSKTWEDSLCAKDGNVLLLLSIS